MPKPAADSTRGVRVIFRALRHRNLRLFFAGQIISLVGTWMRSVARSWLVYRLTGSSVLLGLVGFAGQVPVFLLAPVGGAFADRHNRHRLVIATQAASMILSFVLAALTLTGVIRVWHIMVLAVLLGVVNAFDIPTRQAFIVELVGREDLLNAIALNSSMVNLARVIGPAIAGLLVAIIGEGWVFFADGASYIAVIAGLLLMTITPRVREGARRSALSEVAEGFRFAAQTRPIRMLLLLLGLASLVGMPYAVLMPIVAEDVLHSGARGLGILMGAAGIGALSGALALASRRSVRGLERWVAAAAFGFGAALVAFTFSRTLWLSMLLLVPVGFAMMLQMASSNTLIQTMVPDRLRGRVMSVYSMMFMGMAPFGALIAGAVAERLGAPRTIAAGGVICMIGAAVFFWRIPHFRVEARRLIVAQEAAGGEPSADATGGVAAAEIEEKLEVKAR
jgi:MFS family permease